MLGPTQQYYAELLPKFREYTEIVRWKALVASAREGEATRTENLTRETLEENARTSPENNSSVITMIDLDDQPFILTADAGAEALFRAAEFLDESGFDWSRLRGMQIPHHGSRDNVTPSVLDRYLGETNQEVRNKIAYVSCSPRGGNLHPAKRVTNAFYRRGCKVFKTAGITKRHFHDAPPRGGYSAAKEVPFYKEVD